MTKPNRIENTPIVGSQELGTMAQVLEGRHGFLAADVAEFFSSTHLQNNDRRRGSAWARVAEIVREREAQRLAEDFMADID
jgi:hypothetical protein